MRLFDWFRGGPRQEEPEEEWWQALRRLQSDMQQLQLSWEETYGKVRRALATLAKRQQREGESDGDRPVPDQPDAPRNGRLTPHEYGALMKKAFPGGGR